ncbi:uncharacterized protein METZ01_LOCUS378284 [marine metagenome]|uniref:Uncharacterized protein n=1 Tax=marine metagenome TaxID=408172 RepID=A0A382TTQ5_9ZZZZ
MYTKKFVSPDYIYVPANDWQADLIQNRLINCSSRLRLQLVILQFAFVARATQNFMPKGRISL